MKDRITISISGAAEVAHCGPSVVQKAIELGRECARLGAQLATGATSGFPAYAAKGYKEVSGAPLSIGLSPASTKKEHLEIYLLPIEHMDVVVYTGFGFPGRDLMLVRSSDAVIIGCGRIGTIHEFTVAWESEIPIGILQGEWPTDEVIENIIKNSNRTNPLVVFDSDPVSLVNKIYKMVQDRKEKVLDYNPMLTNIKAKD
ncbi:MAG: hypothetical protein QG614_107 [Patescibacteria group bacterium]|nr:hypothetical protein [Patescibacteria group bacterium]